MKCPVEVRVEFLDASDIATNLLDHERGFSLNLVMVENTPNSEAGAPRAANILAGRCENAGQPPLFTIITASYNCREKLAVTLASVLNQTNADFEYLIIDGGSKDGTLEEISRHSHAVRWLSEPDGGVYDAMNKGIRLARGQFLYFIGAGDTLLPGCLQNISQHVERHGLKTSAAPCFIYADVFSESLQRIYGGQTNRFKLGLLNICHQAIFYDKRIFELLGSYDLKYRILADHAFNIRCFGARTIRKIYLNQVVANYEAAGLSSAADHPFQQDHPTLIRQHLGRMSLLFYKLRYIFPQFFQRWILPRMQGFHRIPNS